MVLFRTYNFYGKHANYMEALVTPITEILPPFFRRNIDVMFAASVVGFKFNKKADIDRSIEATKKTIMVEQIYNEEELIKFLYRLILLSDDSIEPDIEKRIKMAFSSDVNANTKISEQDNESETYSNDYEKLFYQYILGGIEYLYENLIGNAKDPISNMGNIINEISSTVDSIDSSVPDITLEDLK